jgi:hypothetical protein
MARKAKKLIKKPKRRYGRGKPKGRPPKALQKRSPRFIGAM